MAHINQADGTGEIDIGGTLSPVSYQVVARPAEDGTGTQVQVKVSLPRDWLMERGFETEAALIREDGSRETLRAEDRVGTEDPIAVVLRSAPRSVGSDEELGRHYPELLA